MFFSPHVSTFCVFFLVGCGGGGTLGDTQQRQQRQQKENNQHVQMIHPSLCTEKVLGSSAAAAVSNLEMWINGPDLVDGKIKQTTTKTKTKTTTIREHQVVKNKQTNKKQKKGYRFCPFPSREMCPIQKSLLLLSALKSVDPARGWLFLFFLEWTRFKKINK